MFHHPGHQARARKFIRIDLLERLLLAARYREELALFGTLFPLAYVFLLRLPSEALPAVYGQGALGTESQSERAGSSAQKEEEQAQWKRVAQEVLVQGFANHVPHSCSAPSSPGLSGCCYF